MFIVLVGAAQNDIPLQYMPTYQPPGSHICLIDPTIDDEVYATLLSLGDDNTIIAEPFDRHQVVPERDTFVICYTEEVPLSRLTSPRWTTIYCPHSAHGFPLESLEVAVGEADLDAISRLNTIRQDTVYIFSRDRADSQFVMQYNDICMAIVALFSRARLSHPIVTQLLSGLISAHGLFTSVGELIYDRKKYAISYRNLGDYRIKMAQIL
jgi:hypothetical protein